MSVHRAFFFACVMDVSVSIEGTEEAISSSSFSEKDPGWLYLGALVYSERDRVALVGWSERHRFFWFG